MRLIIKFLHPDDIILDDITESTTIREIKTLIYLKYKILEDDQLLLFNRKILPNEKNIWSINNDRSINIPNNIKIIDGSILHFLQPSKLPHSFDMKTINIIYAYLIQNF